MSTRPFYLGHYPVSRLFPEDDLDDYRWCGRYVELSDFADIREYADCCLEGTDPSGKWPQEALTPDLDDLDGVLWQLDQEIPWFTEKQEQEALDHLPARPESLPEPRTSNNGKIAESKLIYKQWEEKQAHIAELQRYWDENKAALQKRVELGKRIAERRKRHQVKKHAIARLRKRIQEIQQNGIDLPSVQEVNWVILPGGESIWTRVSRSFPVIQRRYPSKQLDSSRIEKIATLKPDEVYLGKHEFDGYFVFLFHRARRAVLECPWVGNAIYVIRGDWRQLSRLTKSDLLNRHRHEVRRIIHRESGNWFSNLESCLNHP
jgi:hypothetical protein